MMQSKQPKIMYDLQHQIVISLYHLCLLLTLFSDAVSHQSCKIYIHSLLPQRTELSGTCPSHSTWHRNKTAGGTLQSLLNVCLDVANIPFIHVSLAKVRWLCKISDWSQLGSADYNQSTKKEK